MRKIFLLLLLLLCAACASSHRSKTKEISLSDVEELKIGVTNKTTVLSKFGQPSTKRLSQSNEIWEFEDLQSGRQRLSLEFNSGNSVARILWVPRPNEAERDPKKVFSKYSKVSFKPVETKEHYHSIDTETVFSDGSSMSILVDNRKQKVEALTWFSAEGKTLQVDSQNDR